MKSYLIIIPARGGSKGVPDKNIIEIAGKPLVAYSIEVAAKVLAANVKGEAVVSTDSVAIANIAREWGGNVPFMRPDEISGDTAKSVEFLMHALDIYQSKGRSFDATILLQPTSPQRTTQDVLQAVGVFEVVGQPSLISVYKENRVCDLNSYHRRGDIANPLNPQHNEGIRRQEHEELYVRNGAVYITDVTYLRKEQKVISDTPALYVMPKSRSVDLDTVEDLEFLKLYFERKEVKQHE